VPEETAKESANAAVATQEAPESDSPGHRRKRSGRRALIEWSAIVVIAVLVSLLMRTFVLQTFFIPSGSMEPTLLVGDRILVSKLSLEFGSIHRGDILVFKAPPSASVCGSDDPTDFVKRVIGLPGDHLTSKGNTIYVNNKPLKITWTHYEPLGKAIGNVTVAKNHYFMMGDNYPYSCDSRWWGTVPRSDIIGRAFLRIWPLSRIGFL
jgi:signal peptidase I